MMMTELFSSSELIDLIEKVVAEERLSFDDGVRLFNSNDLLAIGYMADINRKRKHGKKVYFVGDADSTATLFYDHIENIAEWVGRLLQLRELQDQRGGYLTFAPLPVTPKPTALEEQIAANTTGFEDIKVLSIGRILLDNFDHVKACWTLIGPKLTQVSLGFGVDELDGEGTQDMTQEELVHIVKAAGYEPVGK
jgi:aminodeoxyfutalosine synthase